MKVRNQLILFFIIANLVLANSVMAVYSGYYAGKTSEGHGIGLHVDSDGDKDSAKVTVGLYGSNGYIKDTTMTWNNEVAIMNDSLYDGPMVDTTVFGSGTPYHKLTGKWNYSAKCIINQPCPRYTNTTGSCYWTSNETYADPDWRSTNGDISYTVEYLGTSAPGSPPARVTANVLSGNAIVLNWASTVGALKYVIYYKGSTSRIYSVYSYPTSTSDTIYGLSPNTRYNFFVEAVNVWGTTNASSVVSETTLLSPPYINSISTLSASALNVDWYDVSGAVGYKLYRSTSVTGTYNFVSNTSLSNVKDTGLTNVTKYYYKVTAIDSNGRESELSSYKYGVTAPLPPTNLSLAVISNSTINLTWTASDSGKRYYIYRSNTSGSGFVYIGYTIDTSFSSTGLYSGTKYFYKVKTYYTAYSDYTEEVSAFTVPDSLDTLSLSVVSSTKLKLDWSSKTGASSYKIYKYNSASGVYAFFKSVSELTYTDTGLIPNTQYKYKVSAVNSGGESELSKSVSATTSPASPSTVRADLISSYDIYLQWTSSLGASNYAVYISKNKDSIGTILVSTVDTFYLSSGLDANTTYYYRIVASNSNGSSPYSDSMFALTAPSVPTNVKVVPVSASKLNLSWNSSNGATLYKIYRATSSVGPFNAIDSTSSIFYSDTGLNDTTIYYYKVSAKGTSLYSGLSDIAYASTFSQPILVLNTNSFAIAIKKNETASDISFTVLNSGSGSMAYSISKKVSWLSVTPDSGVSTGDYITHTISFSSSALDTGIYKDTIVVTASRSLDSTKEIAITLTVSENPIPLIALSTNTVNIDTIVSDSSLYRKIAIRNSGTGTLNYSLLSDKSWLTVSPSSGSSSGEYDSLLLKVSPSTLTIGTFTAKLTISDTNATNNPQVLTVNLNLTPVPVANIVTSPDSMIFTIVEDSLLQQQKLFIANTGNKTLNYSISSTESYLKIGTVTGVADSEIDTILLTIQTDSLSVGTHNAKVIISDVSGDATADTLNISITVNKKPIPIIGLSDTSYNFSVKKGSNYTSVLRLRNNGAGTLNWFISTSYDWISVSSYSGTAIAETDSLFITFSVDTLDTGTYFANLIVNDTIATLKPETLLVSCHILPNSAPTINVIPNKFDHNLLLNSYNPTDTFKISNLGGSSLNYLIKVSDSWILLRDTSGICTNETDSIIVSYDISKLNEGTHTGFVIIEDTLHSIKSETLTVVIEIKKLKPPKAVYSPSNVNITMNSKPDTVVSQIIVRNQGEDTLKCRLKSLVSWITISDTTVHNILTNIDTVNIVVCNTSLDLDTGVNFGYVVLEYTNISTDNFDTCTVQLTINPPAKVEFISVPNGKNDTVYSGVNVPISWSYVGHFNSAKVSWSTNSKSSWEILGSNLSPNTAFNWFVKDTTLSNVYIKIELYGESDTVSTVNDIGFPIRLNHKPQILIDDTLQISSIDGQILTIRTSDADKDSVTARVLNLPVWAKVKTDSTILLEPIATDTNTKIMIIADDNHGLIDTMEVVLQIGFTDAISTNFVNVNENSFVNIYNGLISVKYRVHRLGNVKIALYNSFGIKIKEYEFNQNSGWHSFKFSGELTSGVYFLRIENYNFTDSHKIMFEK